MVNRAPGGASMAAGDGGADSSRGRARARHGEVRDVVEEALARGIKGWWPEVAGAPAESSSARLYLKEKKRGRVREKRQLG